MKKMKLFDIDNYDRSILKLEIQSLNIENFINLLWNNKIYIKNLEKINISTITFETKLKDFNKIEKIIKKNKAKIRIIDRRGLGFFVLRIRKSISLVGGILIFFILIFYLSTYIWKIDITTTGYVSPYELRQQLKKYGVVPGIKKKDVDIYNIEEKLIKQVDELAWVRIRFEGSNLKIDGINRQTPPSTLEDNTPCNLVAKKDGQIVRIYTIAGTPTVELNDIVKKGDIIVTGQQGKEDNIYAVHAQGNVIARITYEEFEKIPIKQTKKIKTGNKIENYYIEVANKKIYLKNSLNKFQKYDKIIEDKFFIKKEIFYETKDEIINFDINEKKEEVEKRLYKNIVDNFDKSVKIIDKLNNCEIQDNQLIIRVLVITEENIAMPEAFSENETND